MDLFTWQENDRFVLWNNTASQITAHVVDIEIAACWARKINLVLTESKYFILMPHYSNYGNYIQVWNDTLEELYISESRQSVLTA